MCRFIAYLGEPIIIDELLIKPNNSLIRQSTHAREMREPLNGDGFGLGWYVRELRDHPAIFRSITPAWNNQNLRYNASVIQTNCMFAHVRAASEGAVAEANCHPFHYRKFLMMHNGGIPDFKRIKRDLINRLEDDAYFWINGQTDTEHIFALFIQYVLDLREMKGEELTLRDIARAFEKTFRELEEMKRQRGIQKFSAYNMVITDGERLVGTRYSSDPDQGCPTLYYATGTRYECVNGVSNMIRTEEGNKAVIIVSERLTDDEDDWVEVPVNHAILVEKDLAVELVPLK